MHEALITREHVRKMSKSPLAIDIINQRVKVIEDWKEANDLTWLVNHASNVVFRHHASRYCSHTAGTGGQEVFEKCAIQIVKYEGYEPVIEYLTEMSQLFPVIAGDQLRRFVAMEWIV